MTAARSVVSLSLAVLCACGPVGTFSDDPVVLDSDLMGSTTELTSSNALALRTSVPALSDACTDPAPGACDDLDQDGLTDRWEAIVLHRYRPLLRFDETEPAVVEDASAVLASVGRVALVRREPLDVRVFIMLGYSKDYGSCGQTVHNGDSERVAVRIEAEPGSDRVVMTAAYTAAHEGSSTDLSHVFAGEELRELRYVQELPADQPRWVVFPSAAKHGTYANPTLCERTLRTPCFAERCNPDVADSARFNVLPPVFNAGEEETPLLTTLDSVGFPGDHAWEDQKFCGGLEREGCSTAAREKLLFDPF